MRRTSTISKSGDVAIELRAGEAVIGRLVDMREAIGHQGMVARFENTPAFVDHRDTFRALAKALGGGEGSGAEAARLRAELERAGVHVHHAIHDMRIDEPATISLVAGEVRFKANGAFAMMRSGGLG